MTKWLADFATFQYLQEVAGFLAIVLSLFLVGRYRRKEKQRRCQEKLKTKKPYDAVFSGWVIVAPSGITSLSGVNERADLNILGVTIPHAISFFSLYNVPASKRYELIHHIKYSGENQENTDERRRGLTIGSALFGYPIPESMVLLDRRTHLLYMRHKKNCEERRTYDDWLARDNVAFTRQHRLITVAEAVFQLNKTELVRFYEQHIENITVLLLSYVGKENLPHINALTGLVLNAGRLQGTDAEHHCVRACMTVFFRGAELKVPAEWVMGSALVDVLHDAVNAVEAEPPFLTMVVNNT